jgi:large subunit ribosomal protein L19
MSRIHQAEKPYLRDDLPKFAVGNNVDVAVKIVEGDRERVQTFSGTVIKMRGGGLGRTFTVRRIVQGEGVERVFPIHSPVIQSIKVTRTGRVRRAKLYYLRDRVGKATRLREVITGLRGKGKGARAAGARKSPVVPATETPQEEAVAEASGQNQPA